MKFPLLCSLEDLKQCIQNVVDQYNIISGEEKWPYIKENETMKNLELVWTDNGATISKGRIHDHHTQRLRRRKKTRKSPRTGKIYKMYPKSFPTKYLVTTKLLLREIQNCIKWAIYHKKSTIDQLFRQLEPFTLSDAWGDRNDEINAWRLHQTIQIVLDQMSALSLSKKDIYETLEKYILSATFGNDIQLKLVEETNKINLTSSNLDWDLTWNLPQETTMYTLIYVIKDANQQIDSTVVGDSLFRRIHNLHKESDRFQNGAELILTFEKMPSRSTLANSRDKKDANMNGFESEDASHNSDGESFESVADADDSKTDAKIHSSEDDAATNHSDSGGRKKVKEKRTSRCESLSSCVVSFRF